MVWLLILPLLWVIPYLGDYLLSPGSVYTDLLITHIPNSVYLKQALNAWHTIPLWSPTIFSGYPFIGNPLSGLWYPPGWLGIILPAPLGFNLDVVLHLLLGGVGLYLFLRSQGLSKPAAVLGGVLFEAMPKLLAHMAAGHVTLIYAVAWTPWLLLAENVRTRSATMKAGRLFPGAVLALIALADPRWVAPAGLLWLAYVLWQTLTTYSKSDVKLFSKNTPLWNDLFAATSQPIFALCAAAVLLFPMAQYTSLSTRVMMAPADMTTLSMPAVHLIGLIIPPFDGNAEWMDYFTMAGLLLTCVAIVLPHIRRQTWFWLVLICVSLLLSLGGNIPGYNLFSTIPGLNLLRVPPRLLFLTGLGIAVTAAYCADSLSTLSSSEDQAQKKTINISVFAILVFILFINAGIVASVKSVAFNVLWSSGSAICLGIWIVLAANGRIPTRVWLYGMVLVACTELIVVDSKAIQAHPFVPAQIESIQAARYLAEQQGVFRVYSPSYSLPQNVAAEYGIELADGVDPLQLNSYVHFFASASGVRDSGYSVTLPAFANANPSLDNAAAVPDAQILGRLNVKYVVAGFDITSADLALLVRFGETRIYENLDWMPRAWIEADNGSISRSAKVTFWSPDTIKVETRERGRLVLSEIDYPGWNVTVDGKPSQVVTTDGILRGVDLPDGNLHEVQFQFIPGVFYAGAAISAAAWILLIALFLFRNHISR